MNRVKVSSSNIASVGYDESSKTLEIEFTGGRIYQYAKVPEVAFRELVKASSPGSYFKDNIRERYPTARLG